jgi:putative transposase
VPDKEKYGHGKHNRRSARLKDYDYSQEGAYFVTICAKNRECLFGEIVNGQIIPNDLGFMIQRWWSKLSRKFPLIETDAHVVMPNHFHSIIIIVGADPCVCPDLGAHTGAPLHKIVQWFKTVTTNEYLRILERQDVNTLGLKLWQRNYYEHVIRNERSLNAIREYILNNPNQWSDDPENPGSFPGS